MQTNRYQVGDTFITQDGKLVMVHVDDLSNVPYHVVYFRRTPDHWVEVDSEWFHAHRLDSTVQSGEFTPVPRPEDFTLYPISEDYFGRVQYDDEGQPQLYVGCQKVYVDQAKLLIQAYEKAQQDFITKQQTNETI